MSVFYLFITEKPDSVADWGSSMDLDCLASRTLDTQ